MPKRVKNPTDVKFKMSPDDLTWYNEQCKLIHDKYGYNLDRRDSGMNALRLYLIGEKGFSIEQATSLDTYTGDEIKAMLQDMFDTYNNPKRSVLENLKNMGRIHSQALEKIMDVEIPDIDVTKESDLDNYYETWYGLSQIFIDFSQDLSGTKDVPDDMSFKAAYLEGAGGQKKFETMAAKWAEFSQGLCGTYLNEMDEKNPTDSKRAVMFHQAKNFLQKYRGKKLSDLPTNNIFNYVNYTTIVSGYYTTDKNSSINVPEHVQYVNGESPTYPRMQELDTAINNYHRDMRRDNVNAVTDGLKAITKFDMRSHTAIIPDFDLDTEDLLSLPDEVKNAMYKVYYETFGSVYRKYIYGNMTNIGCDEFDFIVNSENHSIRDISGDKYSKYSEADQANAMILETMRSFLKDPKGLNCTGVAYTESGQLVTVPGYTVTNAISNIPIYDGLNAEKAQEYLDNPTDYREIKRATEPAKQYISSMLSGNEGLLKSRGMDKYDCIFIGDRTLNELYEEKYADRYPIVDGITKDAVFANILLCESFNTDQPIFATILSENELGFMSRHVVPLTFSGRNLLPGQNRQNNIEEVKAQAEQILSDRNSFMIREDAAEVLINRAADSINNNGMEPEYIPRNIRINRLIQRASLLPPASRMMLYDTLDKMDQLKDGDKLDNADYQYRVLLRASKLAENEELKKRLLDEANQIANSEPMASYESYLKCMEVAYGTNSHYRNAELIPTELHEFYEKNTGNVLTDYVIGSDISGKNNYRPREVKLGVTGPRAAREISSFVDLLYSKMHYNYEAHGNCYKYILVGGRTLDDRLRELYGGNYSVYEAGEYAGEIIKAALEEGVPVDAFVVENRLAQNNNRNLSSVPIHIVEHGRSYEDLDPELLAEQKAAYERVFQNATVDGQRRVAIEDEQEIRAKEEMLLRNSFNDLGRIQSNPTFQPSNPLFSAMKAKFYGNNKFTVGEIKDDNNKYTDAEKEALKTSIVPERGVPVVYICLKLAEESLKLKAQGQPGYTLKQIFSVNELSDLKQKYADEFLRVCAENDVDTYLRTMVNGGKAMKQLHAQENPVSESSKSLDAMRSAHLGYNYGVCQCLLDVKQEIEKNPANDAYMAKIGLIDKPEDSDKLQMELFDYASVFRCIAEADTKKYKIEIGNTDVARDISEFEAEASLLMHFKECAIKGEDPYKDATNYINNHSSLNDSEYIEQIPVINNQLRLSKNDSIQKIIDDEFFDAYYIDFDKISRIQNNNEAGNLADCVQIVTPAVKKQLERDREIEWEMSGLTNRLAKNNLRITALFENGREPSDKEVQDIYDATFTPLFETEAVRSFLEANPELDEYDLIKVGNFSLREWAQRTESPLNLQALTLQCVADISVPLKVIPIQYDAANSSYKQSEAAYLVQNTAERNRLFVQSPELSTVQKYKEYYTLQNPRQDVSGISEEVWENMRENAIGELHSRGLIADDKIISTDDILAAGDPVIKTRTMEKSLETFFGPKQKFVKQWAESGTKVYTKDQFLEFTEDMDPKSFTDNEFATIAFFTSLDSEVLEPEIVPGVRPENLDMTGRLLMSSNNWTTDISTNGLLQPRFNNGHVYKHSVKPARRCAADAIDDYENGSAERLVTTVANGVKFSIGQICCKENFDPEKDAHLLSHMLTKAVAVMNKTPELKQQFEAKFTPEELKLIQVIIKMNTLTDNYCIAQDKLKNQENLSAEDRTKYITDIKKYKHFNNLWSENYNNLFSSHETEQQMEQLALKKAQLANNPELNTAADADYHKYLVNNFKPTQEFMDTVLNDEMVNEIGNSVFVDTASLNNKLSELIDRNKAANDAINHEKVYPDPNTNTVYTFTVEPEVAFKNQQDAYSSYYIIDSVKELIANSLTKEEILSICQKYNQQAEQNGWAQADARPELDSINIITGIYINGNNPVGAKVFFNMVFEALQQSPEKLAQFKSEVDAIKLPTEKSFEELVDYPENRTIDDKIRQIQNDRNMNQADKTANINMLNDLRKHLAVRKESTYKFISKYENRDHAGTVLRDTAIQTMEQYKDGRYVGMMEPVMEPSGRTERYNVVKPEFAAEVLELENGDLELSQQHIDNMVRIINKMTEYGMITGQGRVEQGHKYYANTRVTEAKLQLKEAVRSGDLARIRQAKEAYETEAAHMREIHQMIQEAFPDKKYAPGNMDSIREAAVPAEFTIDYVTDSRKNGLYQIGEAAMRAGIPIAEYLKHPAKHIAQHYRNRVATEGFEAVSNTSGSFLDNYKKLKDLGDREKHGLVFINSDGGVPSYVINRQIDGMVAYESDNNKARNFLRMGENMVKIYEAEIYREGEFMKGFANLTQKNSQDVTAEERQQFRQNMKMVFLSGDKIKKTDIPFVQADEYGLKFTAEPNNLSYELSKQNLYNQIIQNYRKSIPDAPNANNEAKQIVEETMFDYLMAHPEDMNKAEFKALEKEALSAGTKLRIARDEAERGNTPADKYKKWKKDFAVEYDRMAAYNKDKDTKLNKRLSELQKGIVKAGMSTKQGAALKKRKYLEEYNELINNRIAELKEEFSCKELTEHYTRERVSQLRTLKANYTNPIPKLPTLVSADPQARVQDIQLIGNRALDNVWEGPLKNLDTYITWRLSKPDMEGMRRSDMSDEEWKMAYKNAILGQNLEKPVLDVFEDIHPVQAQARDEKRIEAQAKSADEIMLDAIKEENKLSDRGTDPDNLYNYAINRLPNEITKDNRIGGLDDPEFGAHNKICIMQIIAIPIACQIAKSHQGQLPVKGGIQGIVKKLKTNEAFLKICSNYVKEIQEEYNGMNNIGEDINITEFASYNKLIQDIGSRKMLTDIAAEQKKVNEANKNKDINKDKNIQQGGPKNEEKKGPKKQY
ncbi:MAG: hypothetical protein J6I58_01890 [Eubacterium sp.]|nr:hypothetical protein [Eubacterium sp.]